MSILYDDFYKQNSFDLNVNYNILELGIYTRSCVTKDTFWCLCFLVFHACLKMEFAQPRTFISTPGSRFHTSHTTNHLPVFFYVVFTSSISFVFATKEKHCLFIHMIFLCSCNVNN
jgi:hypothetical protein